MSAEEWSVWVGDSDNPDGRVHGQYATREEADDAARDVMYWMASFDGAWGWVRVTGPHEALLTITGPAGGGGAP